MEISRFGPRPKRLIEHKENEAKSKDSKRNQQQTMKNTPKPWETVPGPSKSIPKAWILSENEKIPPQNAFSAVLGSENHKKASADQLKTLYKTKPFAHPRENQGFLEKIRDSSRKSGIPWKNQGFHEKNRGIKKKSGFRLGPKRLIKQSWNDRKSKDSTGNQPQTMKNHPQSLKSNPKR